MALTLTAVLALAGAAGASAAPPAQISGKVTKVPAEPAAGQAVQVVAVHLPDGQIVDADRVDGSHYALSVPKGATALLTQVIPLGRAKSTSVLSAAVKVKPGERVKLKLKAKKRKRKPGHGHHGRIAQRSGARVIGEDGTVYPGESVALKRFTGATGDWAGLNAGLPDMLITDLVDRPAGCQYTLVERIRYDAIVDEVELGRSGIADPDSAVQPGHLIPVELSVEGTLSNAFDPPAPLRYEIRLVEAATGTVRATLRGFFTLNFFAEEKALAAELAAAICAGPGACVQRGASCEEPPPPVGSPRYTGPISGRYTAEGFGQTPLEIAWTGNAEYTLTNEFSSPPFGSGLPEPGPYAYYETSGGSVHATLNGTDFDGCQWSGETDIAIPTGAPWGTLTAQEGVANPAYSLVIYAGPSASIPYTKSGGAPSCTGGGNYPLDPQQAFARTPTPQSSPSPVLVGSATYQPGAGQTENYDWNLTPGG